MANKRVSNFELLRIFSMFIILWAHMVGHGVGHPLTEEPYKLMMEQGNTLNRAFVSVIGGGGVIGYSIFFLISGYFAKKKKRYRASLSIVNEVFFYSIMTILVGILGKIFLGAKIKIGGGINSIIPY